MSLLRLLRDGCVPIGGSDGLYESGRGRGAAAVYCFIIHIIFEPFALFGRQLKFLMRYLAQPGCVSCSQMHYDIF